MPRRTRVARTALAAIALALVVATRLAGTSGSFAAQAPSSARSTPEQVWRRAEDAWHAGRYPEALRDMLSLLGQQVAPEFHERIALTTGELFTTTEITANGRNPRISDNGQFVLYDTGGPAPGGAARLVSVVGPPREIATIPGTGATLDASGQRVAWLRRAPEGAPAGSDEILVRDVATGLDRVLVPAGLLKAAFAWSPTGDRLFFLGGEAPNPTRSDVYAIKEGEPPTRLTTAPGFKDSLLVPSRGNVLVFATAAASPFGGRGVGPAAATVELGLVDLSTGTTLTIAGVVPGSRAISADGQWITWFSRTSSGATAVNVSPTSSVAPRVVRTTSGTQRITGRPALSPDGELVAYQFGAGVGSSTDLDIHVSDRAGLHRRVTRDIQHDWQPRFLTSEILLGVMGEGRHLRSHVYGLASGARTRVFANNTIRTISPEYAWVASGDGSRLVIESDRDGDTVSPAHGIYLVDLTRKVTMAELTARLNRQLRDELDLRARMTAAYRPVDSLVRDLVGRVSPGRVYDCQKAHAAFDSKHITQPGNARAIDHLEKTYASYGYAPELQWLSLSWGSTAVRTANVVATLKGTTNADVIYVVSSHFDSVTVSPGADDDTSGTCALVEAARVLADTPLPATVMFASFTGEEAGLLGSREFVRLAKERQWQVAGALNNDMIGWAGEGPRLDNTVRYSNAGIRDLQHGASFYSALVLFDSRYYQGTDAAALYDAWGDIVGGLGSYPILANPNYHQATDLLETVSTRQIAETAKVTVATIVALASSPSRVKDVAVSRTAKGLQVKWRASPESDVERYVVAYGPEANPLQARTTVRATGTTLPPLAPGTRIAVKAVNVRGLESWDWARAIVP